MSKPGYLFLLHVAPRIDKWLIPRTDGRLSSMGRNGVTISYTVQTIKGIDYAIFSAASGTYVATYQ